ncbi:outer membrane beta-barrel protein [Thaumasiovibrio subtropicus]|uniref:outer membrane beta-barrel protein n=1 Tax=Thaumasiovibrio subtropicus TaxID=1891207 RepID=UPI000B353EED|nr:outer membrane beta-barrel protein [Thaumasiovibrio subtropicus]
MKGIMHFGALMLLLGSSAAHSYEFSVGVRLGGVQQKASSPVRSMKDWAFGYGVESTFIVPVGSKFALGANVTAEIYNTEFKDYRVEYDNRLFTGSLMAGYRFDHLGEYQADNALLYVKAGFANWDREYKDTFAASIKANDTTPIYGIGYRYTNTKNFYTGIEVLYFEMDSGLTGRGGVNDYGQVDNTMAMISAGYRF